MNDASPELRTDPLTNRKVIIAPGRRRRGHLTDQTPSGPEQPEHVEDCPLCPGNEHMTTPPVLTIPSPDAATPWAVRVVPNLYPIVSPKSSGPSAAEGDPLRLRAAVGAHEVVVETPIHNLVLPDRDESGVSLLLSAYQQRTRALAALPSTRHVVVFKNHGIEGGTSLAHPHSQIVALDFVPADVTNRVRIARRYHQQSGRCLLCELIDAERREGRRIVFENEGFVALCPFASGTPGEVLLLPKAHEASFETETRDTEVDHAGSLAALLRRVRDAFNDPPYNLLLHTAPVRSRDGVALHWYWQVWPRLTRPAGFELSTGVLVNAWPPEEAAELLRR